MADEIDVSQIITQVAYSETPQIQVSNIVVQILYQWEPEGPTQGQLLRHGTWFGSGIKQKMWWAK